MWTDSGNKRYQQNNSSNVSLQLTKARDKMELIQWVVANAKELWVIVASVVTVASLIVKITPSKNDDAILAKIMPFLEKMALNKK